MSMGWAQGPNPLPGRQSANLPSPQSTNATILTFTSAGVDTDYWFGAQVNVTVVTTLSTTIKLTYTGVDGDVYNVVLPVHGPSGFVAAGTINAAEDWETMLVHARVKASTTVTIATTAGTFTNVTYSASATALPVS
jgi:hypothetical protein